MTEFETTDDRDPSAELEEFLEREWDLWHAQEGHDPDQDWSSLPIRFVAREANGLIVGAARGRIAVGMGYLDELMVAKEHRGRGIGGNLVERFETL
ncbi:MAG: GNAT family N-acetyltransferase [Thermomicrobiales bacterium]